MSRRSAAACKYRIEPIRLLRSPSDTRSIWVRFALSSSLNCQIATGHRVSEQMSFFSPLADGCQGAASRTFNSKQQMQLLDQCKTVCECQLQLLYACKVRLSCQKLLQVHHSGCRRQWQGSRISSQCRRGGNGVEGCSARVVAIIAGCRHGGEVLQKNAFISINHFRRALSHKSLTR